MYREYSHKRKRGNGARGGLHGNRNWNNNQQQKHKHWDEPGDSAIPTQHELPTPPTKKPKRYQIDHSLTQEDLWDDSALIAAWDAAAEEYESLNGPEKKWKEDPVNKSALWYAPPPKPQEEEDNEDDEEEVEDNEEEENADVTEQTTFPNSAPIDFNTFVPSHDPTLGGAQTSLIGPQPPTNNYDFTKLTKDEVFEKAVSASYWAGYWAAMYHARNAAPANEADTEEEEVEADEMVYVVDTTDTSQNTES